MRHLFSVPLVPSSPSKSDAAEEWHPNGGFYRDGFDGGSELKDDSELDDLVFPHDHSVEHYEGRKFQAEHEKAIDHFKHEALERSRDFSVTVENVTGECSGPPKYFGKE